MKSRPSSSRLGHVAILNLILEPIPPTDMYCHKKPPGANASVGPRFFSYHNWHTTFRLHCVPPPNPKVGGTGARGRSFAFVRQIRTIPRRSGQGGLDFPSFHHACTVTRHLGQPFAHMRGCWHRTNGATAKSRLILVLGPPYDVVGRGPGDRSLFSPTTNNKACQQQLADLYRHDS